MQKHTSKIIGKFLEKSFSEFKSNSIYEPKDFKNLLTVAAHGDDFIETVSSVLPGANSDTLFRRIEYFTSVDAVIEAFNSVLGKTLCIVKTFSRNRAFTIAIDTTYEPYYGEKKNFWIHGYKPKKGCTGSFCFIMVSIVQGDKRFVLYALPVHLGWNKAKTIAKLLAIASSYIKIKEVLFDRGFYSAAVIDEIKKHYLYTILVSKNKLVKCMLESVEDYAVVEHELLLNKNFGKRKVKTNLVLIRDEYDWCFATNMYLHKIRHYIMHYI